MSAMDFSQIDFSALILFFLAYSVMGWLVESFFCSIPARRWINRGILGGPYCLLYGFGAGVIITLLTPLRAWPVLVFVLAVAAACGLEYISSLLLELFFGIRWWDYTGRRFTLRGRVWLPGSLLLGGLGAAVVYWVHPVVQTGVLAISSGERRVLASVVIAWLLVDLVLSLNAILKLEERGQRLKAVLAELNAMQQESGWFDLADLAGSLVRLRTRCRQNPEGETARLSLQKLEALARRKDSGQRLLSSFPNMRSRWEPGALEEMRKLLATAPAASSTRQALRRVWTRTKDTAHQVKEDAHSTGLNLYKIVWVFFIACFAGFVVETLYCLATTGAIESRQGMVYGPFNQVYGFGAVLMVALLSPLAKKGDSVLFFGSAVIGGAFEYLCSYLQERAFGSVSWEYSTERFNLHGRTSLTFMFFWGILGVFFIKVIYPRLSRMVDRIPRRQGAALAVVMAVFLSADMLVSGLAVSRWAGRQGEVPPQNGFEAYLDHRFGDEMLAEIYPNMVFLLAAGSVDAPGP